MSFLCDRHNTDIPRTQPGFINFIVLPLFRTLTDLMPPLAKMVAQGEANAVSWAEYSETENDKKIYEQKSLREV